MTHSPLHLRIHISIPFLNPLRQGKRTPTGLRHNVNIRQCNINHIEHGPTEETNGIGLDFAFVDNVFNDTTNLARVYPVFLVMVVNE